MGDRAVRERVLQSCAGKEVCVLELCGKELSLEQGKMS